MCWACAAPADDPYDDPLTNIQMVALPQMLHHVHLRLLISQVCHDLLGTHSHTPQ